MRLWLIGGKGAVQMVLLFNWSKSEHGKVKGEVEVYSLDPAGNEILRQTEVIVN
jgi:hypothetical protein